MDQVANGEAKRMKGFERRRLDVNGVVQGVGFRPLVYRLAMENQIKGFVCNQLGTVIIEAEGFQRQIENFIHQLLEETKDPAKIDRIKENVLSPIGYPSFTIKDSGAGGSTTSVFPPDLAVCPSCLSEANNPELRFYQYPFTSCTYCGPRYSIIRSLPYDRPSTAMSEFSLCTACQTDYFNPTDRRFHAQAIACPDCGPRMEIFGGEQPWKGSDWLNEIRRSIQNGEILAIKGIGGFHLLCDASQRKAVQRLRVAKRRPRKPLALMARDLQTVQRHFELATQEVETLTGRRAPILLLQPKRHLANILPLEWLCPGHQRVGVMLPYTPLHSQLFGDSLSFLVATSGNRSGLPIARTNEEAQIQLMDIADRLVYHDREIVIRVEDSVCQWAGGQFSIIRRSRGYVPEAVAVAYPVASTLGKEFPSVIGVGAEKKNTFCLLHADQAIVSQHIGDIDTTEQVMCWKEGTEHIFKLFGLEPQIIAYDPHPGFVISEEAKKTFAGKIFIPVYHHHAHMTSCMAEHGLASPVIGCILDGTGYGKDGSLWGFEILVGDYVDFERDSHLQPFTLPGGEAAIRKPWMLALALIHEWTQNAEQTEAWASSLFPAFRDQIPLVLAQIAGRIPSPKASSAGRLFDGVSALLGLCTESTYEGEAAILLGEKAEESGESEGEAENYPIVLQEGQWRIAPMAKALLRDVEQLVPPKIMARKFHQTVAQMVCLGALRASQRTGIKQVVLSGGSWQNRYLLSCTKKLMVEQGLSVFTQEKVPAGDGGIALGQAVSAIWRWHRDVSVGTGEGAGNRSNGK